MPVGVRRSPWRSATNASRMSVKGMKNFSGITPTTVCFAPLSMIVRPMTSLFSAELAPPQSFADRHDRRRVGECVARQNAAAESAA